MLDCLADALSGFLQHLRTPVSPRASVAGTTSTSKATVISRDIDQGGAVTRIESQDFRRSNEPHQPAAFPRHVTSSRMVSRPVLKRAADTCPSSHLPVTTATPRPTASVFTLEGIPTPSRLSTFAKRPRLRRFDSRPHGHGVGGETKGESLAQNTSSGAGGGLLPVGWVKASEEVTVRLCRHRPLLSCWRPAAHGLIFSPHGF